MQRKVYFHLYLREAIGVDSGRGARRSDFGAECLNPLRGAKGAITAFFQRFDSVVRHFLPLRGAKGDNRRGRKRTFAERKATVGGSAEACSTRAARVRRHGN